jgi:hypothetical protein
MQNLRQSVESIGVFRSFEKISLALLEDIQVEECNACEVDMWVITDLHVGIYIT